MKVTVYRDMEEEGWPSMDRYADRLVAGLRSKSTKELSVVDFTMRQKSFPGLPARISKYISRTVVYPRRAAVCQGDINHVVDHSYGHLLPTLDPAKTVVTCHDLYPLAHPNDLPVFRIATLLWKQALKGMLRAARLICDSEFTREELLRLTSFPMEKTAVVHLGVDDAFKPIKHDLRTKNLREKLANDRDFLLLHVGHCGERKNIEGLFEILAAVRGKGKNAGLVQVGGSFTEKQRTLLKALRLDRTVVQLPKVSEEDLVLLYNLSDVLVFPSLYEGFGFPPLEAMACGLPVVTTNVASLPEVVGDAGISLEPTDIEGFAEAVAGVLSNEELSKSLSEAGLKRAALFTWEKCVAKTLSVYEELYRERGGSSPSGVRVGEETGGRQDAGDPRKGPGGRMDKADGRGTSPRATNWDR